jgi:hypothetical protein
MGTSLFPLAQLWDSAKLNGMMNESNLPEASEADAGTGPSANTPRGQAIPIFGFVNADCFPDE